MNETNNGSSLAVSRGKMIALMAIYAAPLVAAWLWFAYVQNNEGAGVRVNGELIKPAVPIEPFGLANAAGEPWGLDQVREKWSLVYFSAGKCDDICEKSLYNMRQVRLSTGRRMERLQRVLVTEEVQKMDELLKQANEGLFVVGGSAEQIETLAVQIKNAQTGMSNCVDCIYMVDPFGNVMMRFAPDLDPKKMLKDVMHLLKISRIG